MGKTESFNFWHTYAETDILTHLAHSANNSPTASWQSDSDSSFKPKSLGFDLVNEMDSEWFQNLFECNINLKFIPSRRSLPLLNLDQILALPGFVGLLWSTCITEIAVPKYRKWTSNFCPLLEEINRCQKLRLELVFKRRTKIDLSPESWLLVF